MSNRNQSPSRSSIWGVSFFVVFFASIMYAMDINLYLALDAIKQVLVHLLMI